ncbi:MAG: PilX N-terminal domain-containing pilus assembly protein [Gammaproteobacteria bacterium]|nr:PilX N-terminal domain-containing pilus assembly protein [Gammaproteobacteria bacterium]
MDRGVAERLTGKALGPPGQGGAVLFLGLALLLAITAGALSAAQTTSLELRMSRNSHDAALAFRAADAALAEAEAWLEPNGDPADARVYAAGTRYGEAAAWRDQTVWAAHGQTAGMRLPGVVEAPRHLIEWVTTYRSTGFESLPRPLVDVFRVTATAVGSSRATAVRLQATFARNRDDGEVRRLSWTELDF